MKFRFLGVVPQHIGGDIDDTGYKAPWGLVDCDLWDPELVDFGSIYINHKWDDEHKLTSFGKSIAQIIHAHNVNAVCVPQTESDPNQGYIDALTIVAQHFGKPVYHWPMDTIRYVVNDDPESSTLDGVKSFLEKAYGKTPTSREPSKDHLDAIACATYSYCVAIDDAYLHKEATGQNFYCCVECG